MLHPTFRSLFTCYLAVLGNSIAFDSAVFAQIVPDQSTATEVRGNTIAPVGAGTVNGSNLYNSFDKFNVPNSGVVFNTGNSSVDGAKINNIINRVTGDSPSQILGTIESRVAFPNANLFLMNPNGVVFGKDARLDIGGSFNVSTGTSLGFAGDRKFSADKTSLDFPSGNPQNIQFAVSQPAAIINQGNLSVDAGKNITFTAGAIVNSGALTAPNGNISLASVTGGSVVDLRSPDLVLGLSVVKNAVPTDWNGSITTLPKLAELLTGKAQQGDRVVVKPDGTLAIVATPSNDQLPITNGTTAISGTINTSSVNTDGGKIGIFGDRVALINSQISATGINGGTVLIGGDFQGNGVVPNAQFTYFDSKSIVDVSALTNGNGGRVIVWGDITTQFLGTILSKGGSITGDGGFVEVSGKENLTYRGNADTSATNGKFGTLLLDPLNITIILAPFTPETGFIRAPDNNQLDASVPDTGDLSFRIFFNDGITNSFTIDDRALNNATSNIILQARNDINVNVPLNIANPNISFTAQAGNNINVNQSITTNRGNISLLANNGATATGTGSVIFAGNNITTNGGNFTASGFGINRTGSISIDTSSTTGGNSGNININVTGSINVNSSLLFTGINSGFIGNSGSITLRALGNIQASALQAADAVGGTVINGGNVTVDAGGNITIGTLGSIATRSTSGGKAGEVLLRSGGSITALGTTGINTSVIGSSVGGSQAGNVTFEAGTTINTDAAISPSINSNTVIGNAGNIKFTAGGNITATGDLIAANLGTGNGGKIDVTSNTGSITLGNIAIGSLLSNSDNITLSAANNITANFIASLGNTKGGDISLTSTNGSVQILSSAPPSLFGISLGNCVSSIICSAATNATGGNINVSAGGNLSIINSSTLFTNGGNITIAAGNITASAPIIFNSISTTGGGKIDVTATGDINAPVNVQFNNYVGTGGTGSNGDVFVKSTNGNITLGNINAGLTNIGSSNSINLNAAGNITFQGFQSATSVGNAANLFVIAGNNITSTGQFIFTSALGTTGNSGNVQFTSTSGNITTGNIVAGISALNSSGNTGNITLSAFGNIQLATVDSGIAESTATGKTGKINITSGNGTINAGNVTSGVVLSNSNGNDTTISARGAVTLLNVGTGSLLGTGSGGNLVITGESISAGALGAASTGGASGKISLTATNNISADFLLNLGKTRGGDVEITAPSGTISINSTVPNDGNLVPCVGSSICTAATGGTAGNITIAGNLLLTTATKFLATGTPTGGVINLQNVNINGTQNLILDSGNGAINLSNIGATNALGTLTINAGSILANQAIAANNISFTTTGDLTVNKIQTNLITTNSGNILLNSGGSLTLNGTLDTSSTTGTSGLISLTAARDIFANGAIILDGRVLGGRDSQPISITSQNGNITGSGLLDVFTTARNVGNVTFKAANSVLFRDIKTDGSGGTGGNVTITATSGNITGNSIIATSQSVSTGSGNVTLTAKGDIAIALIDANTQNGKAGDIKVQTELFRSINGLKDIQANSLTGQGGNITISGNFLPNAGLNILAGGAIAGSTIDLRNAALLIGGNLIINSANSDILLGETSVQPFNFEIRNARNVTLSQRLLAEKVDITNTGVLKFTDANTLIEAPIFQQQNASQVQLVGEIRGTTITFKSPVLLTGKVILTASDAGLTQGTIAFNSTLNGGGQDLKLSANELDFGNNVSGINTLTLAPSSASVNIQLGGIANVAGTFTLTETDLSNVQAGGLGSLIIGGDFGAQISIVSPLPTFLQKTIIQADGFGNIDSTPTISQGSIIASAPVIANGSDTLTFIASQNVNISDVTNTGKDIIVTSVNANVITGNLTTTAPSVASGNVTVTANRGSVNVNSIVTRSLNNNAGNVNIGARDSIQISGNTPISGIDYAIATFTGTGNGGNISLISNTGGISINAGRINTGTSNGTSGSVTFQAFEDIITSLGTTPNPAVATFIGTGGTGIPNFITFTSNNGAINTSAGDIDAGGGAVTFTARNNITTSGVFSRALNGGAIKLESRSGSINTTAGDLTTSTDPLSIISTSTGGTINLLASGNITTRGVFATGRNGNITLESQTAGINTSLNDLASSGSNTKITLKAPQDIVTSSILAQGDGSNISITSTGGNVDLRLGFIQTGIDALQTGNGGTLTIRAAGNIAAGTINAPNLSSSVGNASSVNLTSDAGEITFRAISARRSNGNGNGGAVNIQANGNITSTGLVSFGGIPSIFTITTGVFSPASGNGGLISLTSTNGSINTRSGTVGANSQNGSGGNITFTSNTGAIATGDLLTSGTTRGGSIVIDARTQIDVGRVNSNSSFGSGGNVILDPIGNVTFTTIDATGNTTLGANGGNINIVSTGGNVLGTGQLIDSNCVGATICTNGTGTVSIQHGITSPFDLNTFLVGSATTNGTLGTIIAGGSTILSFRGIPNGAGFFTQGNVSITPGGGVFIPPSTPIPPATSPATSPATDPTSTSSGSTFINPIIITSTPPVIVSGSKPPSVDINDIAKRSAGEYLALGRFEDALNEMEKGKISEFENYLGESLTPQIKNLEQIQQELDDISNRSGSVTTVVYPIILSDRLELLIIPPKGKGKPFREFVNAAKESTINPVIQDFANNIRDVGSQDYLEQAQKLYDWLVRPYSDRLATINNSKSDTQINSKQNVKPNEPDKLAPSAEVPQEKLPPTLVFVMDGGLRVIPIAALHDGKQYLIEKYALANLPYLRATRLESRDRRLTNVLAMGLTESVQGFSALPSVKVEVSTISSQVLGGDSYLDKEFTVENLQTRRRQGNFAVLHLATHAKFVSNDAQGAFIQFWNERLSIDRIPSLRFDSPLIEMLTLSACQTAVGQNLGLGGLSVSSGARSVLASLWEVSDTGTAPLMIQFYNSFPENITKAIALQRSQIEILQGKVTIKDGKIFGLPKLPTVPLSQASAGDLDIKHPYFWSSFILIGNWL